MTNKAIETMLNCIDDDAKEGNLLFLNTNIKAIDALLKSNLKNKTMENSQLKKELQKYIFSIQTLLYINYDFKSNKIYNFYIFFIFFGARFDIDFFDSGDVGR